MSDTTRSDRDAWNELANLRALVLRAELALRAEAEGRFKSSVAELASAAEELAAWVEDW